MTTTCQLCERPLEDGYLCLSCTKDTRVRLECLPDLYAGLVLFLAPAARGGQGRGSRPVHAPMPVSEDVLDLRGPGGIVGVVENWSGIMRRDRGRPERQPHGTLTARLDDAVADLLDQMPWAVVSWPDAAVFAQDIRDLTDAARTVIMPRVPVDRGTRIGNCPAEHDDGTVCGAVLRLMTGARVVTCEWCGCTYPPATWSGLKVLMDADVKELADAGR
ncbi:hypothetical protein [Streptomyces sp. NPDC051569]|uniref:hypothetical protein n=1 Tax=Streptomyces sp. NPDC051569 TaxID=3365661 RepID=UPI00379047A9